jgi:hypothetical protein
VAPSNKKPLRRTLSLGIHIEISTFSNFGDFWLSLKRKYWSENLVKVYRLQLLVKSGSIPYQGGIK